MNVTPNTLPGLLMQQCTSRPRAPALRAKRNGIWQTLNWQALAQLVADFACGLADAGVAAGDRVAVVGEHRPHLQAALLALQILRAVPVPLFPDAGADELQPLLQAAQVRHAIVEDQSQLDKLLAPDAAATPLPMRVWVDNQRGLRGHLDERILALSTLLAHGRELHRTKPGCFAELLAAVAPDDPAVLLHAEDAHGETQAVLHSHRELMAEALAQRSTDALRPGDQLLPCLPLAWPPQFALSVVMWLHSGCVLNLPESERTLAHDLREIGPTWLLGTPHLYEELLRRTQVRLAGAGRLRRWLFAPAAGGHAGRARRLLARLMLHVPLRNALGLARVRVAHAAGGPIAAQTIAFCRAIGVPLTALQSAASVPAQALESRLRCFQWLRHAVVMSNGCDNRACALVSIDFDAVGRWADRHGIAYASYGDLAQAPEVATLVSGCIAEVNGSLPSQVSGTQPRIERFAVLHKALDADDGELTRTNQPRRALIARRYGPLFEGITLDGLRLHEVLAA